jgi:hypothetical protein
MKFYFLDRNLNSQINGNYFGCYNENGARMLSRYSYFTDYLTRGICAHICQKNGYLYSGAEYS